MKRMRCLIKHEPLRLSVVRSFYVLMGPCAKGDTFQYLPTEDVLYFEGSEAAEVMDYLYKLAANHMEYLHVEAIKWDDPCTNMTVITHYTVRYTSQYDWLKGNWRDKACIAEEN